MADNNVTEQHYADYYRDQGVHLERNRVIDLLNLSLIRIRNNKGRGWEAELTRLLKEVEAGHQNLPIELY